MISNEQFDLSDASDDEFEEEEQVHFLHLALPFDQSRIISPIPDTLTPIYESANCGRLVRIFGGTFRQINPSLTGFADMERNDFVGVVFGEQRGRIMVYDAYSEFYVGWLASGEYEFITPFRTDLSTWTQ